MWKCEHLPRCVSFLLLLLLLLLCQLSGTGNVRASAHTTVACKIFCDSKILHYVQMKKVFNNSMDFVKMKLRGKPEDIERNFDLLLNKTKDPNRAELQEFVSENFEPPITEFETWVPDDWKPQPKFIHNVYDLPLRNWLLEVNGIWKQLGRKLTEDVHVNNSLYSQIYIPYPFIIPGGRFTEMFYWDSYWVIEGLLLSEMFNTAKGMIENFLHLVNKYGYVPNGTRKYYLGRSQPPFLISMVDLYWKATSDKAFLRQSLPVLEKEYQFWHDNRSVQVTVEGESHRLFQYRVKVGRPRPESYYQDTILVTGMTESEQNRILSNIRSAAESGWDFSSRWFLQDGKHSSDMKNINTSAIAPVCLNSLMGHNARLLSQFFWEFGNDTEHDKYRQLADEINVTMSRIFWSGRDGVWLDYNIERKELIDGFYASNLMPLWTEMYGMERSPEFIMEQVVAYLLRNGVEGYPGGIPVSLYETKQQWDFPLVWAPEQYMIVLGLHKAGRHHPRARELAYTLAEKWVHNVYQTYLNSTPHSMFEKYNATEIGVVGNAGEYVTQTGFGWTNGVVMKFLDMYGHKLKTREMYDPAPIAVGVLLLVVSLAYVASYLHRMHVSKPEENKVQGAVV